MGQLLSARTAEEAKLEVIRPTTKRGSSSVAEAAAAEKAGKWPRAMRAAFAPISEPDQVAEELLVLGELCGALVHSLQHFSRSLLFEKIGLHGLVDSPVRLAHVLAEG